MSIFLNLNTETSYVSYDYPVYRSALRCRQQPIQQALVIMVQILIAIGFAMMMLGILLLGCARGYDIHLKPEDNRRV